MAGKTAKRNVWVGGNFYAAGDEVPKEDADQITNEKVWTEDPDAARVRRLGRQVQEVTPRRAAGRRLGT